MENTDLAPDVEPAPAPAPAPTADTTNRLAAARNFAVKQYEKIRDLAAAQVENVRQYTQDARRHINEGWNATCDKAKELHKAGEACVREHPTGAVLGALGLGVIIGMLIGRSR